MTGMTAKAVPIAITYSIAVAARSSFRNAKNYARDICS